jgi:hypothetical protein
MENNRIYQECQVFSKEKAHKRELENYKQTQLHHNQLALRK